MSADDTYGLSADTVAELKAKWGLDRPVYIQYFVWLGNILQGDMGESIATQRSVSLTILEAFAEQSATRGRRVGAGYHSRRPLGRHLSSASWDRHRLLRSCNRTRRTGYAGFLVGDIGDPVLCRISAMATLSYEGAARL